MKVLVTGATAGFGAAIVRRFAADGHRVVAMGRRNNRLETLANEFGLVRIHPVVLDVRDRTAVEAAIGGLPPDFTELDLLVNNAGLAVDLDPAQNADLDAWDAMVDTNVKGLMYVTRAVLPGMVARNRGLIINLGSTAATYPYPGGNVYGRPKHSCDSSRSICAPTCSGPRSGSPTLSLVLSEAGILHGAISWRPGKGGQALRGGGRADAGGHRRDDPLDRNAAAARQRQRDRTHAGDAGFRAACRPSRGPTR